MTVYDADLLAAAIDAMSGHGPVSADAESRLASELIGEPDDCDLEYERIKWEADKLGLSMADYLAYVEDEANFLPGPMPTDEEIEAMCAAAA